MKAQGITPAPTIGRLAQYGLISTLIATLINAILYFIGTQFTFPDDALTPLGVPVTIMPVVLITLLSGIVATIGYIVLTRFVPVATARRLFWILVAVVLIVMFFPPFNITNVPFAEVMILQTMHLVAGLLPAYHLTKKA